MTTVNLFNTSVYLDADFCTLLIWHRETVLVAHWTVLHDSFPRDLTTEWRRWSSSTRWGREASSLWALVTEWSRSVDLAAWLRWLSIQSFTAGGQFDSIYKTLELSELSIWQFPWLILQFAFGNERNNNVVVFVTWSAFFPFVFVSQYADWCLVRERSSHCSKIVFQILWW